jgi:FKBP-type peptidyl-prolyl cis-trans isomerase (trigger factor)
VLAAVVQAEGVEPTDEQVLEALEPTAQRAGTPAAQLLEELRTADRLEQVRAEVANRLALELLVREAKPISVEQAKARDKLWTPGKEDAEERRGALWTPSS